MRKPIAFVSSLCATFAALIFLSANAAGQGVAPTCASITVSNLTYTQDFNSLSSNGTSSSVPAGFGFAESGTLADNTYGTSTGTSTGGNTYSFGSSDSDTDRAFGGLQTSTSPNDLIPTIGACFTNNTGGTINSIQITFDGEQWRRGTSVERADRLDFQYSLNATSLTTGAWIDVNELDFTSPITTGSAGALNGNLASNRTAGITFTISGLNIPVGATFYIRYLDFNASNADDGLAIDNFSLMVSSLTAALAEIGGRIANSAGRGLSFITVTLEGGGLFEPKYARTNNFGYYRFTDVPVGEGYVVTAKSKRYVFRQSSVFVGVNQNLTGVDFIGEQRR